MGPEPGRGHGGLLGDKFVASHDVATGGSPCRHDRAEARQDAVAGLASLVSPARHRSDPEGFLPGPDPGKRHASGLRVGTRGDGRLGRPRDAQREHARCCQANMGPGRLRALATTSLATTAWHCSYAIRRSAARSGPGDHSERPGRGRYVRGGAQGRAVQARLARGEVRALQLGGRSAQAGGLPGGMCSSRPGLQCRHVLPWHRILPHV
mmetsp:Transcript_22498/g.56246  ORF Transcript_22498/g.56246 Transcript_22498/m.56246 type:complete len:209 (-) Transcript_22498:276-902(-)